MEAEVVMELMVKVVIVQSIIRHKISLHVRRLLAADSCADKSDAAAFKPCHPRVRVR